MPTRARCGRTAAIRQQEWPPPGPHPAFRDFGVPTNRDPRSNILHLGPGGMGLVFESSVGHVHVDGLDIAGFGVGVRIFGARGIALRNMEILASGAAIIVNGGSEDIVIDNVDMRPHRAPWVAWSDFNTAPRTGASGIAGDSRARVEEEIEFTRSASGPGEAEATDGPDASTEPTATPE